MGLFRKRSRPGTPRRADLADRDHLRDWAQTRVGVEAYLEPQTTVTEPTVMLIAHDGEWTRRRVPSHDHARSLCAKINVPVYDVALTGYPQRKRDYDARRASGGQLERPDSLSARTMNGAPTRRQVTGREHRWQRRADLRRCPLPRGAR